MAAIEKRQRTKPSKTPQNSIVSFTLISFKEDKSYSTVSSISSLLPIAIRGSDLRKLLPKTKVKLTSGLVGKVVASSIDERELFAAKMKLENGLQQAHDRSVDLSQLLSSTTKSNASGNMARGNNVDADASEEDNEEDGGDSEEDNKEDDDASEEEIGNDTDKSKDENDLAANEDLETTSDLSSNKAFAVQLKELTKVVNKIAISNSKLVRLQETTVREIRKLRQSMNRRGQGAAQALNLENIAPIVHGGIDLARLGEPNTAPSEFGILLARHLWSDEGLKDHRVGSKRRTASSRPCVSPNRGQLFFRACHSRLSQDNVAVDVARDAANQLGNDIKRGIRLRKP